MRFSHLLTLFRKPKTAAPTGGAPGTPTGLGITPSGLTMALVWNPVTGATSYNVKRATTSGAETLLLNQAGATYTDTGLTPGVSYYYVVSAVNASGESANSAQVSGRSAFWWPMLALSSAAI